LRCQLTWIVLITGSLKKRTGFRITLNWIGTDNRTDYASFHIIHPVVMKIHRWIITLNYNSLCTLDSLMKHVSAEHEAMIRQIRHRIVLTDTLYPHMVFLWNWDLSHEHGWRETVLCNLHNNLLLYLICPTMASWYAKTYCMKLDSTQKRVIIDRS
jgi:hypothetical protein